MSHSEPDIDRQTIEAVCRRDSGAMHRVYERYSRLVVGICRRYLADADIPDVVQNVFVRVFTQIDRFEYHGIGSFRAWISRIALNETVTFMRRHRQMMPLDDADEIPEPPPPDVERLTTTQILDCLAQLPTIYRTIFNLYVIDGNSHSDIAEMLGIDPRTSATRLSRAKKMLATLIIERYGKKR